MKRRKYVGVIGTALFLLTICAPLAGGYAQEAAVVSPETTLDNLMTAYNSESNASARCLAFAEKANIEGYDVAANLFRTVALAQQVRYERYAELIKKLGGTPSLAVEAPEVKSTQENLEAAFKTETYKKDVAYPAFLVQAEKENIPDAIEAFKNALATEGVYTDFYASMLNNMSLSQGLAKNFYVCPVCGNIMDAITVSMCPICATETKKFRRVR